MIKTKCPIKACFNICMFYVCDICIVYINMKLYIHVYILCAHTQNGILVDSFDSNIF